MANSNIIVTFLIIAPYKYFYLLTYLCTYLLTKQKIQNLCSLECLFNVIQGQDIEKKNV